MTRGQAEGEALQGVCAECADLCGVCGLGGRAALSSTCQTLPLHFRRRGSTWECVCLLYGIGNM